MPDVRFAQAKVVAGRLRAAGASECLLVGGFVRDHLMGIDSKDIDIEVYGLSYEQIIDILKPHCRIDVVGRSFGVVKVDNEIDISLPRRESKIGVGHKGFSVTADSTMTPREAAARRDFTINAIGMTFDGTILDPFGGQRDIKRGVLRATSSAFGEDPLRVLRGMQFAARFGFEMETETIRLCRCMKDQFVHLPRERVWGEWFKWATRSKHPSRGLLLLEQTGWSDHFPTLSRLRSTPQNPDWHPEGDVFIHTAHVCDAAAEIAERDRLDPSQRAVLLFAALCHDFGKPATTVRNERGQWVAPQHAKRGVPLARAFLTEIGAPGGLTAEVLPLVAEHMVHTTHPSDSIPSQRTVRRLAMRLAPASIRQWSRTCESDASGRPPLPKRNPVVKWMEIAEELAVENEKPQPILQGCHLISRGFKPGPEIGRILNAAFEAQLDGEFDTIDGALRWVNDHDATGVSLNPI